jgi:hypothetical protein
MYSSDCTLASSPFRCGSGSGSATGAGAGFGTSTRSPVHSRNAPQEPQNASDPAL